MQRGATTIVMDSYNRSVELYWYAQEPFVQLGNKQESHCIAFDTEHNKRRTWGVVRARTSCIDGSKERRVSANACVRGMLFANSSVLSTCVESVFFQQQYAQHLFWLSYCRAAVGNTSRFDTVGSFNSWDIAGLCCCYKLCHQMKITPCQLTHFESFWDPADASAQITSRYLFWVSCSSTSYLASPIPILLVGPA